MRKTVTLLIGAASVAALLAITACKQFTADIDEDFSYWAAEPVITNFRAASPAQTSSAGVLCVSSASDAVLTLTVHNPKNFSFIMPNSPGAPTDIVSFGGDKVKGSGGAKPVYDTDYTLEPTPDNKALKLTYTAAFLKANEWSDANIGASIKLYSTDGRKFNQNYSFDLEANTPPPDIAEVKWGKTVTADTDGKYYYVLCIEVPNMPGAVVNGKPLHKDIAHIAINDTEYELKMKEDDSGFEPMSAPFLTAGAVAPLDGTLPSGKWVLYYKTPTAMGSPQASYTVTLKDAKGLRSQASATTPTVPITEWGALRTAVQTASDGAVITVGGDITYGLDGTKSTIEVTKSITVKSNVNGTKRTLSAGGTGADGSSANQKSEAVFEVNGSGITLTMEDLTLTKTEKYAVYVYNGASLVMNNVTIEDCKTNFNAVGIYFYKGKNLTVTNSVIKKCNGKGGFSAGGIDIQAPQAGGTLSITNTRFENCKAVGNGTYTGDGGGIHIYEGSVTLTGCTFTGCEAKNGGGIYLSGNASCTLDGVTMQDNTAPNGKGSAVYVAKTASDTPTLTLKGNVQIGDSTPNSNTLCLGYAVNGSTIQTAFVSATYDDLNASTHINIEPEDYIKQSNLDLVKGTDIRWRESSFHLTNIPTLEGSWKLRSTLQPDRLALERTTAVLSAPSTGSWKALKEVIQSVSSGGTLKLNGLFKATSGDDSGEILLRKVLTIEGNSSAVIDADNKCRIFNLQNYLILKDVTLERGDATSSDDTNGGAVYVSNVGELKIEGSTFIVPPATAAAGKNDVYLKGDRKISVDGALTGGYPVARITPENYSGGTQVLYGDITSGTPQNNTKFAVTPENDGTVWCVGADGKLALVQTETLTAANETQLENNILNAVIGKPRIITITADISSSSIFEIQNGRDITIKADGTQKTLTCELPLINKNVFHIKSGGKLTLEGNIKLQGTNYGSFERFGIYVEQGGIAEIKDNVVITGFQKTGSACVYTNGTLIMSGGKITGNQADNGGGVFIFNNGTFTMTGGTIIGNHANTNGKAMWIRGIFNWLGGTITGNTGTGDVLHIKLNGKINNPYGFEAS